MSLPDPNTARLRKAIFAACRQRGLDDDARHEIQLRVTGKASMTQMDGRDMRALLDYLNGHRKKGFRYAELPPKERLDAEELDRHLDTAPEKPELLPDGPITGKLRALWISAYWLGVVRARDDHALAAWICRQTGYGAAKWMTPKDADRLVEALKGWMERDGGVDWSPYPMAKGRPKRFPAARILEALWRKLHDAGEIPDASPETLSAWVRGFRRAPDDYVELNHRVQNQLIRELGRWRRRTLSDQEGGFDEPF